LKNFNELPRERWIYETENFFVVKDGYPVSPGHSLIISKALKETFFDLSDDEKKELVLLIETVKDLLESEYTPDGYNIAMNCGAASGQTIPHFHCHVIPRYMGCAIKYCIPDVGFIKE